MFSPRLSLREAMPVAAPVAVGRSLHGVELLALPLSLLL